MRLTRRNLFSLIGAAGVTSLFEPLSALAAPSQRILDTHIHLFDPRRPGGIPWPLPGDLIDKPSLPARYSAIATPLGVRGAIAVEASPRSKDNAWVLGVAARNPIIVGFVGDLIPGSPAYAGQLDTLHANPLFLGIRYGNLRDRDLGTDAQKPEFLSGLKQLAAYGLELDSANPDPALIAALLRVSEKVPELRIVIDHLPSLLLPAALAQRSAYLANLRALAANPNVFVKLSEIPVRVDGKVQLNPAYYQAHLDELWTTFGERRLLFGSDWPNSDHLADYAQTLGLVRSYVRQKGAHACDLFFWQNSIAAYRWKPRLPDQAYAQPGSSHT